MQLRWAALALAWLLVGADAPVTFTPLERESGVPVKVTSVVAYVQRDPGPGGTTVRTHLYCISFAAINRALRAVTLEISHRRLDDTTSMVTTQQRTGTFLPGVEIRSYKGEEVEAPSDRRMDAGCVLFPPVSDDAPLTIVRPIAATFADGTSWRAKEPPPRVTP